MATAPLAGQDLLKVKRPKYAYPFAERREIEIETVIALHPRKTIGFVTRYVGYRSLDYFLLTFGVLIFKLCTSKRVP